MGSSVFAMAFEVFGCSMWDLVPWPRIEPRPLALSRVSPWTTREVPIFVFLKMDTSFLFLFYVISMTLRIIVGFKKNSIYIFEFYLNFWNTMNFLACFLSSSLYFKKCFIFSCLQSAGRVHVHLACHLWDLEIIISLQSYP